jgi:hypothetical protein
MPNKSKRVAVRQAKLSQRKGHHHGPTSVEQMQRRNSTENTKTETRTTEPQAKNETVIRTPIRSNGGRTKQEAFSPIWQTKSYIRRELLQIGIASSLIFATLFSLTFIIN